MSQQAGSRKRGRRASDGGREASDEPQDGGEEQQQQPRDRREEMANIARQRAAHFARYDEDEEGALNGVHAGGKEARNLGPWSSAVELVEAREQAAELRRQRLEEGPTAGEEAAEAVLASMAAWQPSRDPKLGARPPCRVQPLLELCVAVLVEHVECIESLAGVPDVMRVKIAQAVSAQRKLAPEVSALFAVDAPGEVVLPSCVLLDKVAMSSLLVECVTPRLERLELGFCGIGFGDDQARAFAQAASQLALPPAAHDHRMGGGGAAAGAAGAGPSSQGSQPQRGVPLRTLLLGGPYRLSDAGLAQVLRACPRLEQLLLPKASRITGGAMEVVLALAPTLRHLDLTECRGVGGEQLLHALPKLTALERLTLDGIGPEADDRLVLALAGALPALRALSLNTCTSITSASIAALAAQRPLLQEVQLSRCDKVTDDAILALAEGCKELKLLSVRRCARLSDAALAAVAYNGSLQHLVVSNVHAFGPLSMAALAGSCQETLERLDISFCRAVSDAALGLVADNCVRLRKVLLFGCSQLTDRSINGHSNTALGFGGCEGIPTSVTSMACA